MLVEDRKKLPEEFPFEITHFTEKKAESRIKEDTHWHNFMEITYVEEGTATYFVNGTTYDVEPSDIIIFNHTEAHRWQVHSNELKLTVLMFASNLISDGFNMRDLNYLIPFLERGSNFTNKISKKEGHNQEIKATLDNIMREVKSKEPGSCLMIKAYILKILTILVRYFQYQQTSEEFLWEKKNTMRRLECAFEFISENYHKKITLNQVAQTVCMSPNYFSSYFKKATGKSFQDYLTKIRMEKARQMLKATTKGILEISADVGIPNMANFYRLYKKHHNKSPGEERRREKEQFYA